MLNVAHIRIMERKYFLFIAGWICYETVNRPINQLEQVGAYASIAYNFYLNLAGISLAVMFVCILDLFFQAENQLVKLGLYRVTRHNINLIDMQRLKKLWQKFKNNERAITSGEIVGIAVSFFLVAILGPIAIGTIANTTTTNWDSAVVTIFQVVLPILWVVGIGVKYLPGRE